MPLMFTPRQKAAVWKAAVDGRVTGLSEDAVNILIRLTNENPEPKKRFDGDEITDCVFRIAYDKGISEEARDEKTGILIDLLTEYADD